jgi:predicted ATP-binding protein involved in virulence
VLDNIGHFNHVEINVDKQVTCFIGENGSGKTSILQAIALCLAGISDNDVIDPNANEGAIKNMLRINKVDGAKEIFVANGKIQVLYDPAQQNFTNFKFTKGEMVLETGKIVRDLIDVDDRGSDATNTYDNFFKDLTIGFSQTKANRNRAEKANPERRPRISEVTALIYKLEDESFNYFQDWILDIWADKTLNADRQAKLDVLKDIFNVIGRIVGNHFELMPMEINQSQVFIKTAEAVNGIPMRLISQGYYNVIGWIGYFMYRLWEVWTISPHYGETDFKQCPALVLIDEIDTYLHPKWQYTILQVLAETFPKVQFIVTTHSPYVVGSIPNDKIQIYICQKEDSKMHVEPFDKIAVYGSKLDFLNQMVFNTPSRIEMVATIISQMRASIQRSHFEQVDAFKQALEAMGIVISDDPEISSLISLANTKKRIAKA